MLRRRREDKLTLLPCTLPPRKSILLSPRPIVEGREGGGEVGRRGAIHSDEMGECSGGREIFQKTLSRLPATTMPQVHPQEKKRMRHANEVPLPSLHPPSRGREEEGEGKGAYLSNPSLECDNRRYRRQCANTVRCGGVCRYVLYVKKKKSRMDSKSAGWGGGR